MGYDVIVPGVELAQSLRNVGYNFKTALADVVDNSISAKAKNIQIIAHEDDNSYIAVIDDGYGMSDEDLLEAMRLAGASPDFERNNTDLGRFGLGLKTASWSQAKRLTVVSSRNGVCCGRVFDFDKVIEEGNWIVEKIEHFSKVPCFEKLGQEGTLVVWEKLDRIISSSHKVESDSFKEKVFEAAEYLSLVFHRYLDGEAGAGKVNISVNNNVLVPRDPFCTSNKATQIGEIERIKYKDSEISIQRFALPHRDKFKNARDFELLGGDEGFVKNQGFYVYRAKRLVQYGTWFGLVRQTELTKLARVKIDIPNTLDEEWKIDVAKSSVQPPPVIRKRLKEVIGQFTSPAKKIYTARGVRQTELSDFPVWTREITRDKIRYRVNFEHPYMQKILSEFTQEQESRIKDIFEFIAAGFPTDALWSDFGNDESGIENTDIQENILSESINILLEKSGLTGGDAYDALVIVEPFRSNKSLVRKIIESRMANAKDK